MLLRPVDAGAGVIACCRATRGGRRTLELSRTTRVARGRSDVAFVTGTGAASMTFAGTARATTMGVGVRRFTTPASGRARDKTSRGGPDTSESCFWSGVACTAMGDTATVSWLGSGSAGRCTDAWLTVILPGRMVLATYPVAAHARIIGREMYRGTRWLDSEARRLMGAFPDAIRTNRLGLNRSIGHTFPVGQHKPLGLTSTSSRRPYRPPAPTTIGLTCRCRTVGRRFRGIGDFSRTRPYANDRRVVHDNVVARHSSATSLRCAPARPAFSGGL